MSLLGYKSILRGLPVRMSALLVALVILALPAGARAGQVEITIDANPPWKVAADEVTALQKEQVYLLKGKIKMIREGETIRADFVRYHALTQTAEIQGNVTVETPDFKVSCRRLVVNIEHNIGKMYDGTVFFPGNHYYVSGDEIERTGPDSFRIIQGRATTCDGPTPAWSLTGRNVEIKREGYATISHATLSNRFFPMLYIPWLSLPVKAQRQTGLLLPKFSNSQRDGLTYAQPFFWAASDSKDMTINLTYMAKRGLETTVEGRYNDWGGKGTFMASHLKDQDPQSIYYSATGQYRTQEHRYWLRGMANQQTPNGIDMKLDLDFVSDPKLLDEFKNNLTGYYATNKQFLDEFGRDLPEPLDPLRNSQFLAGKTVNQQSFNVLLDYTDNLSNPENLDTIQRLPRFSLSSVQQEIPGTPFYFGNEAEYVYFYRRTNYLSELKEKGHRLDLHPTIYWPARVGNVIDLETRVGLRETMYLPYDLNRDTRDLFSATEDNRFMTRELYDLGISASTGVSKVYDVNFGDFKKLRHRIQPEASYSFRPKKFQGDLPYWDVTDRLQEISELRIGLTNYLTGKVEKAPTYPRKRGSSPSADQKNQDEVATRYLDLVRFGFYRIFDYEYPTTRDPLDRVTTAPVQARRPRSPYELDFEINYQPYLRLTGTSAYDTASSQFTDHDFSFQTNDLRGDYLAVDYELHLEPYRGSNAQEYEEIRGTVNVSLNPLWDLQLEKRYSIMESKDIEAVYALEYRPQCWGLRFEYSDSLDDRSFSVVFSLLGFGEVGSYSHKTGTQTTSTTSDTTTSTSY